MAFCHPCDNQGRCPYDHVAGLPCLRMRWPSAIRATIKAVVLMITLQVCLAYSTAKHARETYLAQAWREPRSFTTRYAALLDGLSDPERRARLTRVAEALTHPAIPEEERHNLYVTMHHGHWQAANKCRGKSDQHLCATCLLKSRRACVEALIARPLGRRGSLSHRSCVPTRVALGGIRIGSPKPTLGATAHFSP